MIIECNDIIKATAKSIKENILAAQRVAIEDIKRLEARAIETHFSEYKEGDKCLCKMYDSEETKIGFIDRVWLERDFHSLDGTLFVTFKKANSDGTKSKHALKGVEYIIRKALP